MRLRACLISLLVLAGLPATTAPASAQVSGPSVLVVHDASGPYGYLGGEYALMVRNLLGHFGAQVTTRAVTTYQAGSIGSHDATFYLGTTYEDWSYHAEGSTGRKAWDAFRADVAGATKPVVWMGMNLWSVAWSWDPAWGDDGFATRFGFAFTGLDAPYDRVTYKDVELRKGAVLHVNPGAELAGCAAEDDGSRNCDPILSRVTVTTASVLAEASSRETGLRAPYVVRGGPLWHVGDIPLSYLSEEDRYLAFADLLHDMLGIDHAESHRALVRLEDVDPTVPAQALRNTASVLSRNKAPFGVAVVPEFRDPLRVLGSTTQVLLSADNNPVADALRDFKAAGNDMIQHGTSHQFGGGANPFTGVSGDDFEFYRVTANDDYSLNFIGPVPGDSATWATARILRGRGYMQTAGLTPALGWEPPHYTASAVDYKAIAQLYPVHWARVVYFNPGSPDNRFVGQFFPYPVVDAYGQQVIPENLGNIEPTEWNGYPQTMPQDLIRRARIARVVRDGWASFFFHPWYPTALLEETVKGIQAAGYTFVRPCVAVNRCASGPAPTPTPTPRTKGGKGNGKG